jgi:hypothetical protein
LTVLVESSAKRCPSCHSRLRRRSQPIVLGETSRLDVQAALAVDRWNKKRGEQTFAASMPAAAAPPEIDLTEPEPELVAIVVDPREPERVEIVEETFVRAPLVVAPVEERLVAEPLEAVLEDEPVVEREVEREPIVVADAIAAFTLPSAPAVEEREPVIQLVASGPEPELVPEAEPAGAAPSFLDLALAEHTAARAEPPADIDQALDGDVNSIVDALHRKARGEEAPVPEAEVPQVPLFDEPVVDRSARRLRLMASTSGNRRRWNRRDG